MAQQAAPRALPPGAIRRRALFGLLDADGWTWAGLRAAFWFLFVVFLLGVVPNWAYYFTTSTTLSVGYNFLSVVNLCPADNENLPCPAPAGATLPWQASPPELAMPAARTDAAVFQSGSSVYVIGGSVDGVASAEVLVTEVTGDGNLSGWSEGPPLPEPRADAAVGSYVGVPFVIGGLDASGQPTDTVFRGIVEEGALTGWELADGEDRTDPLTLPEPVSGAGLIPGTSGFMLVGGRHADGEPTNDVFVAWVDETSAQGRLLAWQPIEEGLGLPEPRADVVAAGIGDFWYVVGGEGPDGVTDTVYRLELADREPATDEAGRTLGWAVAPADEAVPEPRTDASAFSANGAIFVIGGLDADGMPQASVQWAVPDTTTGDLGSWQRLEQTDLEVPTAGAAVAGVGAHAFLFGGVIPAPEDSSEAAIPTDGTQRAAISPRPPFFQLGIAGATIPALAIEGEVGQQLGYINAMGVGMTNFVILVVLGYLLSRPALSRRLLVRLSRGRLELPPEEQYR